MKPQEIQADEWRELIQLDEVREGWGLQDDEGPEFAAANIYGVRFDFVSDGPGYVGPLYLLKGAGIVEDAPMSIIREDGELRVVG